MMLKIFDFNIEMHTIKNKKDGFYDIKPENILKITN